MARQPFFPRHRGASTGVGRGVMTPRLAALIGNCSDNWTHVELHLALTMGSLLGVENKASVAVFLSLRNNRAQREALWAAANTTLNVPLKELFKAILNVHRSLDGLRNDIIHGIWGICDTIPDAAIWTSMQDHAVMLIEDYHQTSAQSATYDRAEHMVKDYFLWGYDDIQNVVDEIGHLSTTIMHFHVHLRYGEAAAGRSALTRLNDDPSIKAELARMRKGSG